MCFVTYSKEQPLTALEKFEKPGVSWGYVEITTYCSHGCPWCYGSFNTKNYEHISLSRIKELLNKLKSLNLTQITVTGGEPTQHPNFERILEAIRPNVKRLTLNSHLSGLSKKNLKAIVKYCDQVCVNFAGKSLHKKVHTKDSIYEDQECNIKYLINKGVDIVTTTPIDDNNIDHLKEIFKEAISLGVKKLRVVDIMSPNSQIKSIKSLFERATFIAYDVGYMNIVSYEPDFIAGKHIPCPQASNKILHITVSGDVLYCGIGGKRTRNFIIGNAYTDNLESLISKYYSVCKEQILCGCFVRNLYSNENIIT